MEKEWGPLIVFLIGLILCILYFSVYGFSRMPTVRWAQYLGLILVVYCLLSEISNM
ncbi:MAG: hypothetical protein LBB09_02315 [Rickettsiales bacterium]|jgi:hypothetical protein|nr:hypothetical protein [Rickettsiales bacterium]